MSDRNWLGFRRPRNIESRDHASNHREPWEQWQLELLLDWTGDEDDLTTLAEQLGRTREACRERYYQACRGNRRGARRSDEPRPRAVVTRTTTTTVYHYDRWPEDERSEWYR